MGGKSHEEGKGQAALKNKRGRKMEGYRDSRMKVMATGVHLCWPGCAPLEQLMPHLSPGEQHAFWEVEVERLGI